MNKPLRFKTVFAQKGSTTLPTLLQKNSPTTSPQLRFSGNCTVYEPPWHQRPV